MGVLMPRNDTHMENDEVKEVETSEQEVEDSSQSNGDEAEAESTESAA